MYFLWNIVASFKKGVTNKYLIWAKSTFFVHQSFLQKSWILCYICNNTRHSVKICNAVSLNSPEISDYSHKWLWYKKQEPVSCNIRPKTKVRIPFLSEHSVCRRARKVINNYKDVVNGLRTINNHFQEGKRVFGNTQQRMNKELKDSYDYIIERSKWLIWFLIWILTLLYRHSSFKRWV